MQIKKLHITLLLSLCAALAACSDQDVLVDDIHNGKTPIELSVGGVDSPEPATRAITKDPGTVNFSQGTGIFMLMKSEYESLPTGFTHLNYGGTQSAKYTTTLGKVKADGTSVEFVNETLNIRSRYWDDAHARSSKLSIWAVACDGLTELGGEGTPLNESSNIFNTANSKSPWSTTAITATELAWNVPHFTMTTQGMDASSMKNRDLLYSNNVSNYTVNATPTDNRTSFNTSTGKFGGSAMNFYHAMAKITVKVNMGQGFTGTNDFRFTESGANKNVALQYFNIWGKFNVQTGEWTAVNDGHQAIAYMYNLTGDTPNTSDSSEPAYKLEALVIPYLSSDSKTTKGSLLNEDSSTKAIVFSIDNNKYEVSREDLLKALRDNSTNNGIASNATSVEIEAGKHYEFTFTIGKKQIDNITATIVDWKSVTAAEQSPSNAHITVAVKSEGSPVTGTPTFDLYRAAGATYTGNNTVAGYNAYADYTWDKGYEKSTSLEEKSGSSGVYTTEWFWPNNQTFYHFRTLTPTNQELKDNSTTSYIDIAGGSLIQVGETPASAVDYIWGAPFKTSAPSSDNYSLETGYCNNAEKSNGQLYKAIGATENAINLIQHHMTSQIYVDLANDETVAAENRVDISTATVELINIAQTAQLYLGNGLVTGHGSYGDIVMTADHQAAVPSGTNQHPEYDYSYGVLPQSLSNNSGNNNGKVGLKITAADGNVYFINDLSTINEKNTTGAIANWLPGKKYYYKIVLKKTGITNIQATIVEWETVTADEEEVQIQ